MLTFKLPAVALFAWLVQAGALPPAPDKTVPAQSPGAQVTAAPKGAPGYLVPVEKVKTITTTVMSAQSAKPSPKVMGPAVHPDTDTSDPKHLAAKKKATLHFAEDSSYQSPQQVASLGAQSAENPLVQLEHTEWIQSMTCTNTKAKIVFSNRTAYDVAYQDWKNHDNIVLVSFSPTCGSGHDNSKRDFLLAKNFKMANKTMAVTADIKFIDLAEALGEDTEIFLEIGSHKGSSQNKRFRPRGVFSKLGAAYSDGVSNVEGAATAAESEAGAAVTAVETKASAAETAVETKAGAVKTAVETAASAAESGMENMAAATSSIAATVSTSYAAAESSVDEPWVNGHELLNEAGVVVDCVDCNANTSLVITAAFGFKLTDGVTVAQVGVTGSMGASLQFGIDVPEELEKKFNITKINLAKTGIPALSIPEVLTIGPELSVDVSGGIDVAAQGSLLMGAQINWPDLSYHADGISGDHDGDGLSPDFAALHDVNGSVSAALDLSLPVSLGLDVDLGVGKIEWKKGLNLINTLGMQFGGNFSNEQPCVGTDLFIDLYDEVDLDVFAIKTVGLTSTTTTLWDSCLSTSTSTSSTLATVTSTSSPATNPAAEVTSSGYVYPVIDTSSEASTSSVASTSSGASASSSASESSSFPTLSPSGSDGVLYPVNSGSGSGSGSLYGPRVTAGATGSQPLYPTASGLGLQAEQSGAVSGLSAQTGLAAPTGAGYPKLKPSGSGVSLAPGPEVYSASAQGPYANSTTMSVSVGAGTGGASAFVGSAVSTGSVAGVSASAALRA